MSFLLAPEVNGIIYVIILCSLIETASILPPSCRVLSSGRRQNLLQAERARLVAVACQG